MWGSLGRFKGPDKGEGTVNMLFREPKTQCACSHFNMTFIVYYEQILLTI